MSLPPPKTGKRCCIILSIHLTGWIRDGADGPWSTFSLRVGEPAQNVRVLPSTSSQQTWVIIPEGCPQYYGSGCANDRGWLFDNSTSTTWKEKGLYNLGDEGNLGLDSTGIFGFDTVGLGLQGTGGPTLQGQLIAGIATSTFWLGSIGLNPQSTNFSTFDDSHPSFMSNLKSNKSIPSLSFGYTAGAPYRLKGVPGSLILGGYDQSQVTGSPLKFNFAQDVSRQLVVAVQSISWTPGSSSQGGGNLLPSSILALVDSMVPQFYLPLEACQEFEKAFGLVWDATKSMYPVDGPLHDKLTQQNPRVTFALGNGLNGGETVSISLPYAAFDLTMSSPPAANATRYFPLLRAANSTQYTLGRAFLQEAYLIVDWERATFSLSQTVFQDNPTPNIKQIDPLFDAKSSSSLSAGAIAGIAAGAGVALLTSIILAFCLFLRRRRQRRAPKQQADDPKHELSGHPSTSSIFPNTVRELGDKHERVAAELNPGLRGGQYAHLKLERECPEIDGEVAAKELPVLASDAALAQMKANFLHELPGSEGSWPELEDTSEYLRQKKSSSQGGSKSSLKDLRSPPEEVPPTKTTATTTVPPAPTSTPAVAVVQVERAAATKKPKPRSFATFKQNLTRPLRKSRSSSSSIAKMPVPVPIAARPEDLGGGETHPAMRSRSPSSPQAQAQARAQSQAQVVRKAQSRSSEMTMTRAMPQEVLVARTRNSRPSSRGTHATAATASVGRKSRSGSVASKSSKQARAVEERTMPAVPPPPAPPPAPPPKPRRAGAGEGPMSMSEQLPGWI